MSLQKLNIISIVPINVTWYFQKLLLQYTRWIWKTEKLIGKSPMYAKNNHSSSIPTVLYCKVGHILWSLCNCVAHLSMIIQVKWAIFLGTDGLADNLNNATFKTNNDQKLWWDYCSKALKQCFRDFYRFTSSNKNRSSPSLPKKTFQKRYTRNYKLWRFLK